MSLLDRLLKLELELERWKDAGHLCRELIALLDDGGRGVAAQPIVTYLLTLGQIHAFGLDEPGAAIGYYIDAVARMWDYTVSYTMIEELLEVHSWSKLEPGLGQLWSGCTPEDLAQRKILCKQLKAAISAHRDAPAKAVQDFRDAVRRANRAPGESLGS